MPGKEDINVVVMGETNSAFKDDVNLDDIVDISDATAVLESYAKYGAGLETAFFEDEELNRFAFYLADVDTESTAGANSQEGQIEIRDATCILTYYARCGAGLNPTWKDILHS